MMRRPAELDLELIENDASDQVAAGGFFFATFLGFAGFRLLHARARARPRSAVRR